MGVRTSCPIQQVLGVFDLLLHLRLGRFHFGNLGTDVLQWRLSTSTRACWVLTFRNSFHCKAEYDSAVIAFVVIN